MNDLFWACQFNGKLILNRLSYDVTTDPPSDNAPLKCVVAGWVENPGLESVD